VDVLQLNTPRVVIFNLSANIETKNKAQLLLVIVRFSTSYVITFRANELMSYDE
jgi:hypothetical protein